MIKAAGVTVSEKGKRGDREESSRPSIWITLEGDELIELRRIGLDKDGEGALTLPGVIAYNPDTATLTFRRPAGFLTLYPEMVYITQVQDTSEGLDLLNALKDAINTTWENRRELAAVTQAKRAPRPLDIWTLLPQTNCKQCGEATCLAFAVGLIQQNHVLEDCKPIQQDSAYQDRKATLTALIG
ncbi:MAG: (Fe-S)-binding protein [Anaerolineales bacterium]